MNKYSGIEQVGISWELPWNFEQAIRTITYEKVHLKAFENAPQPRRDLVNISPFNYTKRSC
jgi:hypothetical protein